MFLNLRLYKLPSAEVLLKLEFDTKDQVFLSKILWLQKIVCLKKSLVQKILGSEKMLSPNKYWVQKIFCLKKIRVLKAFWVKDNLGSKQNWDHKILVPKILGTKKF